MDKIENRITEEVRKTNLSTLPDHECTEELNKGYYLRRVTEEELKNLPIPR